MIEKENVKKHIIHIKNTVRLGAANASNRTVFLSSFVARSIAVKFTTVMRSLSL